MSRVPVRVRDAVEADAPVLCTLWADLLLGPGEQTPGSSSLAKALRALGRVHDDPTRRIVLAELDGEVVGVAYLWMTLISPVDEERVVHLSHVQVSPGHVRHGVGRALVEAAVTWAEQQGVERIVSTTLAADREANRFLARLGLSQLAVLRGGSVASLRARLPHDPSAAARSGARGARSAGQVVAARRSQRRARSRQLLL